MVSFLTTGPIALTTQPLTNNIVSFLTTGHRALTLSHSDASKEIRTNSMKWFIFITLFIFLYIIYITKNMNTTPK